jgi:hypothetical protein
MGSVSTILDEGFNMKCHTWFEVRKRGLGAKLNSVYIQVDTPIGRCIISSSDEE